MMKMRFGYVKIGSEKPTATLGIRFAKKYPYMNLKSIITDQFVFWYLFVLERLRVPQINHEILFFFFLVLSF